MIVDLPHFNILLLVGAQYNSVDLIRKKITVCLVTCNAVTSVGLCVCVYSIELMGHLVLLYV